MGKEKIILMVDDDEDDRDLFRDAVKSIDSTIHCITARDGEEALQLLKDPHSTAPDMIFLDLNMPRIDGKKCLKEIKKNETINNIPIVIYTTSENSIDIKETLKDGAVQFLTKPNDFEAICIEISNSIRRWGSGFAYGLAT